MPVLYISVPKTNTLPPLQVSGGSLWGAPTPVSGAMSLAQIQQQEERDRQQRELKLQQLQAQQQREQQARGAPGWAERPPVVSQPVKSLLQIQQEQAQQLSKRQQGPALSRSQVGRFNLGINLLS